MATFESLVMLPAAPARVFALLRRPDILVQLAPPEMRLEVETGPDELRFGSSLTLRGRRWGLSHRIVSEVTCCEPDMRLVIEQRQGPFKRWIHTSHLEATLEGGTQLQDEVEYERPGGLLGLTITSATVERELAALFTYRRQRLLELARG